MDSFLCFLCFSVAFFLPNPVIVSSEEDNVIIRMKQKLSAIEQRVFVITLLIILAIALYGFFSMLP